MCDRDSEKTRHTISNEIWQNLAEFGYQAQNSGRGVNHLKRFTHFKDDMSWTDYYILKNNYTKRNQ